MLRGPLLAFTLTILAAAACQAPPPSQEATLVIVNARVWTSNPEKPWAEAVAIHGETIAAVGSDEEIGTLVGEATEVIDAEGAMVTPGFIDTHVHFLDGGFRLSSVQLRDAATPPGKLADLVMIDRDLTRIPPEEIRDARVLRTIVGGKVVYP